MKGFADRPFNGLNAKRLAEVDESSMLPREEYEGINTRARFSSEA